MEAYKSQSHDAVKLAIRKGILVRPTECEHCGRECKPHGHHSDYSKRLEVVWLCSICHNAIHPGENRQDTIARTAVAKANRQERMNAAVANWLSKRN